MASMSAYTKICPSHPAPAPIPIVGIESSLVTFSASFDGTHSSVTANAPAASTAFASRISFFAVAESLP